MKNGKKKEKDKMMFCSKLYFSVRL